MIFHVLCGTIISWLLTFLSKRGQSDILVYLNAIARDLQSSADALQFTSTMKHLTHRITGRDQPLVRSQEDAGEFYQKLVLSLLDLRGMDFQDLQTVKTANLTKCLSCKCSKMTRYTKSFLTLPISDREAANFCLIHFCGTGAL